MLQRFNVRSLISEYIKKRTYNDNKTDNHKKLKNKTKQKLENKANEFKEKYCAFQKQGQIRLLVI